MANIEIMSFVLSFVLSYIGVPMILNMLIENNVVSQNYKGDDIPYTMGLSFVFIHTISVYLIMLIYKFKMTNIALYLISFILMGLVGLLDDLIGDKNIKGFKGHIKSFIKGKLTTGGIKAGTGFLLSLLISLLISKNIIEIIINTLIIALFTNLINLFDLRPGRSIKVFILISTIMLITSNVKEFNFFFYSFYGILVIYLPLDLKGKAMMGDVGSNILGITLGIYCAFTQVFEAKIIFLIALIVLHVLAEKVSFTQIIEDNRLLKFIDNLGR